MPIVTRRSHASLFGASLSDNCVGIKDWDSTAHPRPSLHRAGGRLWLSMSIEDHALLSATENCRPFASG